mgnify:CR=1 FL=1
MDLAETPFGGRHLASGAAPSVNMQEVVGQCDILFVCLDTLRYDVAKEEEEAGRTPVLNQYGPWEMRQAAGNFTYPSHQAMFAGFLPLPYEAKTMLEREMLFFPQSVGLGSQAPQGAYCYDAPTFVQALAADGYLTMCIGGVSFFDKRSALGSVLPAMFAQSYWQPGFGCRVQDSTERQIRFAITRLARVPKEQRVMLYLNVDAIHYPNYFYLEGEREDNVRTHAAALRYVDGQLAALFDAFGQRGKTFVICCSDHGTCYGEDGRIFHGLNHPVVETIPYKQFFLGQP